MKGAVRRRRSTPLPSKSLFCDHMRPTVSTPGLCKFLQTPADPQVLKILLALTSRFLSFRGPLLPTRGLRGLYLRYGKALSRRGLRSLFLLHIKIVPFLESSSPRLLLGQDIDRLRVDRSRMTRRLVEFFLATEKRGP